MNLLRRYGPGEVCDDPAEESVVRGEADEELQLVVLAQPRARRLDPRDQLRVHPEGGTEENQNLHEVAIPDRWFSPTHAFQTDLVKCSSSYSSVQSYSGMSSTCSDLYVCMYLYTLLMEELGSAGFFHDPHN